MRQQTQQTRTYTISGHRLLLFIDLLRFLSCCDIYRGREKQRPGWFRVAGFTVRDIRRIRHLVCQKFRFNIFVRRTRIPHNSLAPFPFFMRFMTFWGTDRLGLLAILLQLNKNLLTVELDVTPIVESMADGIWRRYTGPEMRQRDQCPWTKGFLRLFSSIATGKLSQEKLKGKRKRR